MSSLCKRGQIQRAWLLKWALLAGPPDLAWKLRRSELLLNLSSNQRLVLLQRLRAMRQRCPYAHSRVGAAVGVILFGLAAGGAPRSRCDTP
jgi:hypothetical protein